MSLDDLLAHHGVGAEQRAFYIGHLAQLREHNEARATIARVREMHQLATPKSEACRACHRTWPCPTTRALDGEETTA